MDNAQICARDGSWFMFADWQGVTRIALPGDKVKTDAHLDRPLEDKPLGLQPNGHVWSKYATDIDPATLKKHAPAQALHNTPDPLDGSDIAVSAMGDAVTIRGETLSFAPSGLELQLGGVGDRRRDWATASYTLFPDGSLVVFGTVGTTDRVLTATFVTRDTDGSARVSWCRPIAPVKAGAPDAFRRAESVVLVDRDIQTGIAYAVEIDATGAASSHQTLAVAGPWLHDGSLWWQPSDETLCRGERLGDATESFTLPREHCGAGRLLRLPGRKLLLPWHGVTMLDLAPVKGKAELSRKHKATDEPMYRSAAKLLLPIAQGMAKRGVQVAWTGVTRSGKRITPRVNIDGPSDMISYLIGFALQDGAAAALASTGVTSIVFNGGNTYKEILERSPKVTRDDLRQLVAMLDAAGINRAAAFWAVDSLAETAAERELPLAWTRDAEAFALAIVLSGLRGEQTGEPSAATPEALAAASAGLNDWDRLRKMGVSATSIGKFMAFTGHRLFGAEAIAPVVFALATNPSYANIEKCLAFPTSD